MLYAILRLKLLSRIASAIIVHALIVSDVSFALRAPATTTLAAQLASKPFGIKICKGVSTEYDISSNLSEDAEELYSDHKDSGMYSPYPEYDRIMFKYYWDNAQDRIPKLLPFFEHPYNEAYNSFADLYLELMANSFDSICDKKLQGEIGDFRGVIKSSLYIEGEMLVIKIVDNGVPVEQGPDEKPLRRERTEEYHLGGRGRGIDLCDFIFKKYGGTLTDCVAINLSHAPPDVITRSDAAIS